jgi:hypothetical protein
MVQPHLAIEKRMVYANFSIVTMGTHGAFPIPLWALINDFSNIPLEFARCKQNHE